MFNNKKVGLIIPTRYGSVREPGKVLNEIYGKKQIERIIERAESSNYIDCVCLAITEKKEENELIIEWFNDYIQRKKLNKKLCFLTGSHENIAQRTLETADFFSIDLIVDISHDCTLFDSQLCDRLIELLILYKLDYSSNCVVRSFPDGFDIQVYTKEIYKKIVKNKECVPFYTGWNVWYNRESIFPKPRIYNLMADFNNYFPEWHLSYDTKEDREVLEKICEHFEKMTNLEYYYHHIIDFLKRNPEILEINKKTIPTLLLKESLK